MKAIRIMLTNGPGGWALGAEELCRYVPANTNPDDVCNSIEGFYPYDIKPVDITENQLQIIKDRGCWVE